MTAEQLLAECQAALPTLQWRRLQFVEVFALILGGSLYVCSTGRGNGAVLARVPMFQLSAEGPTVRDAVKALVARLRGSSVEQYVEVADSLQALLDMRALLETSASEGSRMWDGANPWIEHTVLVRDDSAPFSEEDMADLGLAMICQELVKSASPFAQEASLGLDMCQELVASHTGAADPMEPALRGLYVAYLRKRLDDWKPFPTGRYPAAMRALVEAALADIGEPYDSVIGDDRAPSRYTGQGRETIDRQRDLAHSWALFVLDAGSTPERVDSAADDLFRYLCDAQALRYRDRLGRKGDPAEDEAKARFYEAMSAHVAGNGPDPRAGRPGFTPYERPKRGPHG